jgi:transcriptional regulator with XRE-family HTH domain
MSALEKFAEELKEKRATLGISIKDIYEITRIDKNYLEEMEKGNFEIMPDVYMRAFIRKYADAVECNPEEIIKKYEVARSGKIISDKLKIDIEKTSEEKSDHENIKTFEDEEKKNYNPFLIIGFIVAVVLIGYFYIAFVYSVSNEIIVEKKVEDILTERKTEVKTPRFEEKKNKQTVNTSNIATTEVSILKTDSLSLKINALDTVWFRTKTDNTKNDEFILYPNRSKTLVAKSKIDILIGNTGGVEFILNGKKMEFTGKKGEIRNVIVDSDGIQYTKMKTQLEK